VLTAIQEASESTITFHDDEPSIINAVIKFLYSADYADESNEGEEGLRPLSFNALVYAAADKYDLEDLGRLALAKFTGRSTSQWATPDFADAVNILYTGAPSSKSAMRMVAVEAIRENAWNILCAPSGEKLRKVIGSTPELGLELSVALVTVMPKPRAQLKVLPSIKLGQGLPEGRYGCRTRNCPGLLSVADVQDDAAYPCPVCRTSNDGNYLKLRPK
jgi:hypothetical protein